MIKGCFLFLLLLTVSGCSLFDPLPAGTPPEGAIVRNQPVRNFNVVSAVNYMTTSLSIYLLTNPLPENFLAIDADSETQIHARSVLNEISRVTGVREKSLPCPQVLKTRRDGNSWIFSLYVNGGMLWKEQLKLTLMQ
jgi:hypothetical protein